MPGLKDLIINTDLALEQSGFGGDSGAAQEVGGGNTFSYKSDGMYH